MSPHPPPTFRRVFGDGTQLGYRAASEIRRSPSVVAQGGSGDYHLRTDRPTLIRQSRAYERDNALFQGLHRAAVDNILGAGFGLEAKTANKRVNATLEKLWREEFCEHPEIRGLDKWHRVEELALSGAMVAGDMAAIKLASKDPEIDGKLQLIEAERIDAGRSQVAKPNRLEGGVELDGHGRVVRFYVKSYDPRAASVRGAARKISRENMVYIAHRRRASQTRGAPALVASFPDINRLDDILSSEAASWQILSRLAVKRKQVDSLDLAYESSKPNDNETAETHDLAGRVHDVGMALFFNCRPGEDIEGITHNVPGPNFETSVRVFLRLLGLPLGLPLELIILDWSQTNYSSARAALEQAFLSFLRWQLLLSESWHDPVYEWQVGRWVRQGRVPDRPDIARHEWIRPEFPWLDQLKEAQAWGLKLDRGLATHGEALKSVGRDRADWLETRTREIGEAYEAARRLGEAHPEADVNELALHLCGLGGRKTQKAKKGESTPPVEGPDQGEDQPDAPDAPDGEGEDDSAGEGPAGVRGER